MRWRPAGGGGTRESGGFGERIDQPGALDERRRRFVGERCALRERRAAARRGLSLRGSGWASWAGRLGQVVARPKARVHEVDGDAQDG